METDTSLPINWRRLPTEGSRSAKRQAAPAKGSLFSLFLGHSNRGAGAPARAPGSRGRCRRQIPARGAGRVGRATAAASPTGRGAGKLREDNSGAEKPLPCTARGRRHLQPPQPRRRETRAARGRGEGAPPASSAAPGGPEGQRRADEQGVQGFRSCREPPSGPCLPPSPGENTLRPPAGPVTTPAPGRRRAHTRGPRPSDPNPTPPRDAAWSHRLTDSRAPALRTFPAHLRSAAALHLLARSARPVGARTDPPAGTPPAAVTRDATATAAFSSSAQAPAASRGSRSKPRRG